MKPARMLPTVTFGVAISFFFVPPVLALIGASPAPVRAPAAKLSVETVELTQFRPTLATGLGREMARPVTHAARPTPFPRGRPPHARLSAPSSRRCRPAIWTADRARLQSAFLRAGKGTSPGSVSSSSARHGLGVCAPSRPIGSCPGTRIGQGLCGSFGVVRLHIICRRPPRPGSKEPTLASPRCRSASSLDLL